MSAGSASSRRRKLSSIRPDSGIASGRANPPASSAGVTPRGSSTSASGLPAASATIRSWTRGSSGPVSTESSRARASASPQALGPPAPATPPARRPERGPRTPRRPTPLPGDGPRTPRTCAEALIQPLRVVDQADQWVLLGHLGQQAEGGQPDQEPVRRRPGAKAERRPQRVGLWVREPFQAVQHRRQQLVQPGVGQLHLRLDPGRMRYPAARRLLAQVVQQRRLAHARFAAHHQGAALACTYRVQEPVQHVAFPAPAQQLRGALSRTGWSVSVRGPPLRPSPARRGMPRRSAQLLRDLDRGLDGQSPDRGTTKVA